MEPLEICYYWTEYDRNGTGVTARQRSFKKTVSQTPAEFLVNVGGFRNPVMDSLRLNWPGVGPSIPENYSDGVDVGAAFEAPKYYYTFGKNIAAGKAVTTVPTVTNPGALVDNSTTAAGWNAGIVPEITIDLGSAQNVGGIRLNQLISGGNGEYLDSGIVSSSSDNATYTEQGRVYYRQVWEPITNYNYCNSWDYSPAVVQQKHCNIVFAKFSCAFKNSPTSARYVKIVLYSARGQLAVTELEVYDAMTRTKVNNEIDQGWTLADPSFTAPDAGLAAVEGPAEGGQTEEAGIEASPNPFNPSTSLTVYTGKTGLSEALNVAVYTLDGKRAATLLSSTVKKGNAVTVRWDAAGCPSGVYVVKATMGSRSFERKVTLIK